MAYTLRLAQWKDLDSLLEAQGVVYEFPKGRNDGFMYKKDYPDGLSKYHIHSIEMVKDDDMVFCKLLAKSSNWRHGEEPDLGKIDMSGWVNACAGMDSSVIYVVNALIRCFTQLGAIGPVDIQECNKKNV